MYAVERCNPFNIDRSYEKQVIIIMSDSRASIKMLNSNIITSKMVSEYLDKLYVYGPS